MLQVFPLLGHRSGDDRCNVVPENSRFRYAEAADYLGVKRVTLRTLVCRNQVPYIRLSKRIVVFEREALDRWLNERRVQPRTVEE